MPAKEKSAAAKTRSRAEAKADARAKIKVQPLHSLPVPTKMVNGRVDARSVEKAVRVLEKDGLTLSAFIRNSIEYVAREGVVPPTGFATSAARVSKDRVRSFVREIESAPMPGKLDYGGLSGDELVERIRMERYDY